MKYDRQSFIDGMYYAKEIAQNKLADMRDQNPFFVDIIEELETVLCDEIWEVRQAIKNEEAAQWGGVTIEFVEEAE